MDAVRGVSLASVDRAVMDADGLVDVVVARARLLWQVQAQLLADLAALVAATAAEPGQDVDDVVSDVGDVVAWSLHCSRGYAFGQVDLGVQLVTRLPMVWAALRAGEIDAAKAGAFVEALRHVADEVACAIATRLLPRARTWTLSQLRASLRYHVDRRDPGAARRRYTKRLAERDVYLRAQPDGTANLSGQGLAAHRAVAAFDRIDRIARAARAQGDARNLAQLRADALCDVLAGVPFPLAPAVDPLTADADAQAPADPIPLLTRPQWRPDSRFATEKTDTDTAGGVVCPVPPEPWPQEPPPPPNPLVIDLYDYDRACVTDHDRAWVHIGCEPPGAADDEQPDWWRTCSRPDSRFTNAKTGPGSSGGGEPGPDSRFANAKTGPGSSGGGEPGPDSRFTNAKTRPGSSGDGVAGRDCGGVNGDAGWDAEEATWAAAQAHFLHHDAVLSPDVLAGDRCGACGGRLDVRPGVVDMQVELTTLAGLDEHPGLIPGFGVTLAEIARQVAFDPHTRPVWRWSIFDEDGQLRHHGVTAHRPPTMQSRSETGKPKGTCTCARVEQGQRRGSIEIQLTLPTLERWSRDPVPGYQALIADITAQVTADRIANPPGTWSQTGPDGRLLDHGHTGRMPDAVEEAFIRARDRSCQAPQCQVIAARTELDHRIEYANGGPSHRGNVDCRCKRHHHLRHRHGYHITKVGRTTIWTLPSGRTFTVSTDKDLILAVE